MLKLSLSVYEAATVNMCVCIYQDTIYENHDIYNIETKVKLWRSYFMKEEKIEENFQSSWILIA
jgi:hypothetical protein